MAAANGDVVSLRDLCYLTVSRYLSPFNIWSIYRFVPHVHCPRIKHIVHSFICDNFMDISRTDQFLALDENEMNWILDNEDITVSEAAILYSLVRWYKHSQSQRENAFKRLLVKVQLSVINRDVLSVIIKKYHLHKVVPELRKYKKLLPQRLDAVERLIHQENVASIAVLFCFETSSSKTSNDIEVSFKYWMPMASKVSAFSTVMGQFNYAIELDYVIPVQHNMFIFAWRSNPGGGGTLVNVKLDCNTGTVTKCAPLSWCIHPFYLCIRCGIFIYLLGGLGNETTHKNVYRYDIINDEWTEMQPMNSGHVNTEDVLIYDNRYLLVFGTTTITERYDMCTNTWTLIENPWQGLLERDDFIGLSGSSLLHVVLTIHANYSGLWTSSNPSVNLDFGVKWRGINLREGFLTSKSYFGQNFLLYQKSYLNLEKPCGEIYVASKQSNCWQKKKLATLRTDTAFSSDCYITALSRGARKELDI